MKRIVLTGAESTGKSTLANALAEHYRAPLSHEFVRCYVNNLGRELTTNDLELIAAGQLRAEADAIEKNANIVFHDTNILSSIIYAKHYFDQSVPTADEALQRTPYSLYLLCDTDIPWAADKGQRESPKARDLLQEEFIRRLDQHKFPYRLISGGIEERLKQAITLIDQLV